MLSSSASSTSSLIRDEAYWHEIINQFTSSGLTQKQFCLQKGIAFGSFKSWYYRLRHQCPTQEMTGFVPIVPQDDDKRPSVSALSQSLQPPKESPLILELPNAARIIISPGFGIETLNRLLTVVGGHKC